MTAAHGAHRVVPLHRMTDHEAAVIREIDHEADAALSSIPSHLRSKDRPAPAGSTHLVFSHRTSTPDTRKA